MSRNKILIAIAPILIILSIPVILLIVVFAPLWIALSIYELDERRKYPHLS